MVDWIKYKGLTPFTLPPDYKIDWRGSGSFDIGDIPISKKYNEGSLISSDKNYIWSINSTGNPVTPNRPPNKYWWMNRVGPPVVPIGPHINVPDSLKFAFGIPGGYLIYYYPGGWGGGSVIGTIVDFYVTSTDPFKVISLVKVYIEDYGITDWIPLNYEPLPQYWDTGEHLATDFNEEEGYYENAWMSFRCGDVVIVGTINHEPICVLAFADGAFRVGENIFNFDIDDGFYYNAFERNVYPDGDKGPDGLEINLEKRCEPILLDYTETVNESVSGPRRPIGYTQSSTAYRIDSHIEGNYVDFPIFSTFPSDLSEIRAVQQMSTIYQENILKQTFKGSIYCFLVTVGPILFWIEAGHMETSDSYSTREETVEDYSVDIHIDQCMTKMYKSDLAWPLHDYYVAMCLLFPGSFWCTELEDQDFPGCMAALNTWMIEATYSNSVYNPIPPPENSEWKSSSIWDVYAALYTDELYNRAKSVGSIEDRPPEFILQEIGAFNWSDELVTVIHGLDNINFDIKTHPHTLTELMAAGLWP